MMIKYYFIMALLSFINLSIFIYRDSNKKMGFYMRLLLIIQCVANFGYLALGMSSTLSEAILANKITYLGGCFMPPIMAYFLCALCNIEIKKWIKCASFLFSVFVYSMVLSTGFNNFYYSSIRMERGHGATALAVGHGFGYNFFYIILYGYMIVNIIITIMAYIKKQVTKKNLYLFTVLQCITILSFLIGRAIDPTFEVMPAVYAADGFIIVILQIQLSQYNLDDCMYAAMQQNNTAGYIVIDANNKFMGCNDIAKECIPSLADCKVDTVISKGKDLGFLYKWIKNFKESEGMAVAQTLQYKDSYYECVIKAMHPDKEKTGYIIELQDFTDRKKYMDLLSNYNEELEIQVEQQTQHINLIQQKTILSMASMVENRDNNTGGHIKRTSDVIKILVDIIKENNFMELSDEFCKDLIKAAPMHDLGKIAIEDRILQKPGKFTDEEFEIMKTHAEKSAEIVENILKDIEEEHFVNVAVNVARYHHEKWNGKGYPTGLSGEQIPLEARIMAIADVYDALVSKRCYKDAMSFEKAYGIIIESMGSHFDPNLENVFIKSRDRLEAYYTNAALVEHSA